MPSSYSQVATLKTAPLNCPTPMNWSRQVSRVMVTQKDGSTKLITTRKDQQVPVVCDWLGRPMPAVGS